MLVGQQIGPFSVEKEIGGGAMGTVYLARYTKTGKRVAIKVVAPGLGGNAKAVERFEREAEILKQLSHPNIVRIYAHGKHHGTPYYAMEFVQGESLDKVMARRGRMSWEEVVALGQQLCSALQHAHERGIIHRDLKPSNLMVLRDGTVKLTDFGIAKDLDSTQLTSANCTVGTAAYMSPEQCRGERDLTPKSDLYSLGVLLYELITGHKPFIAETPMDMFLLHVGGQFERPSRLALDIPVWLDNLICQLLEKKPENRPLDAATVGEALSRVREKVLAQQSAGVDLVRGRGGEIPKSLARLDQEDKEAARTLLGKKARKRRRSDLPFYARIWFKAGVYSVLLAGILVVIYLVFLKQPSPEQLFEKAEALMETNSPENWNEAREGPIATFFKYYSNRDDAQAKQMHLWADLADVQEQKRLLVAWIGNNTEVTSEPEALARKAAAQQEKGETEKARDTWAELTDFQKKGGSKNRIWGLLGEQQKVELDLKALVQSHGPIPPGVPVLAVAATDYEAFGDVWQARRLWQQLRSQAGKSPDQETWFILAARHLLKEVPETTDEEQARRKLIQKKLEEAADLAPKKPDEAKGIYQDVILLYQDSKDPKVAKLVAEATAGLKRINDQPKKRTERRP